MKQRLRKILSAVLSTAMFASWFSLPVNAEDDVLEVTTDGVYELYGKVTASAEGATGDVTYKWMYSDSEDGEYLELATAVGDYSLVSNAGATIQLLQGAESVKSYRLPFSKLGGGYDWVYPLLAKGDFSGETSVTDKYVKVVATDADGNTGESTPVQVGGTFGATPSSGNDKNALDWSSEYTGADDFIIDGKSFTLLDTNPNSSASRYLVIANDIYGNQLLLHTLNLSFIRKHRQKQRNFRK